MASEILKIIAWNLLIVLWILLIYYWIMRIRLCCKRADQLEDALHELVNVIAEQHKAMLDYVDSVIEFLSDETDEEEDVKNPCMGVNPPELPVKGEEEG